MRWAMWTSEGVAVATVLGVMIYVCVSYLLTARHVPRRELAETIGSLLRESYLALFITALLPLYVAFGRRSGAGKQPIVLVHGYTQNRVDFIYLARVLRRRGFGPLYGFNYFSYADIRKSGERLARFVDRIREETGAASVDLVCHSMGGLVARQCIRLDPARVRKCVTIASPHAGVRWWAGPVLGRGGRQLLAGTRFLEDLAAVPLAVPTLSIYSRHDNVACPAEHISSLQRWGGDDLAVDHLGHLSILFDARVADAVAGFLG
jgi:triacylglycerol lipase